MLFRILLLAFLGRRETQREVFKIYDEGERMSLSETFFFSPSSRCFWRFKQHAAAHLTGTNVGSSSSFHRFLHSFPRCHKGTSRMERRDSFGRRRRVRGCLRGFSTSSSFHQKPIISITSVHHHNKLIQVIIIHGIPLQKKLKEAQNFIFSLSPNMQIIPDGVDW